MLEAKQGFLFIIDGATGSGKTTVGELIGKSIKRTAVFDMDQIKWQISDFKKGVEDNKIVRDVVFYMAEAYCAHGINVIIPQGMLPESIPLYKKLADKYGFRFYRIDLFADDEILMRRVQQRQRESDSPNPSSIERIRNNIQWYKDTKSNDKDVIHIDTSLLSSKEVKEILLEQLSDNLV